MYTILMGSTRPQELPMMAGDAKASRSFQNIAEPCRSLQKHVEDCKNWEYVNTWGLLDPSGN